MERRQLRARAAMSPGRPGADRPRVHIGDRAAWLAEHAATMPADLARLRQGVRTARSLRGKSARFGRIEQVRVLLYAPLALQVARVLRQALPLQQKTPLHELGRRRGLICERRAG